VNDEPKDEASEETAPETSAWAGLGAAWRDQPAPAAAPLDVAAIRRRVDRLAWRIRLRNGLEWAACAGLVILGVQTATKMDSLPSALVWLCMSGLGVWVAAVLWRRGRNLPAVAAGAATREYLAHERAQLQRQHALLSSVRRWYLGPIFAFVVFFYGLALVARLRSPEGLHGGALLHWCASFAGQVAFFAWIDFANRRAAKKLAARLAALGEPE
jgi:hypothetical protein